jgi:hypothetical protein
LFASVLEKGVTLMKASAFHRSSYPNPVTNRRSFLALTAGGALAVAAGVRLGTVQAQTTGYDQGTKIEGDYTFTGGTYTSYAGDTLYQYAHDDQGDAYYNTYDGSSWSGWEGYAEQPAKVAYDPATCTYDGKSYSYYTGDDGYLYEQSWDTYGEAKWDDVSGDYTYAAAPYASAYEDSLHLYGAADDGYVYHKAYDSSGWGTWEPVNETPYWQGYKPYAVSWGEYDNVFWLGEDQYVYWNRYSYADKTWTGAKQIPSDYTFKATPYAVGYAPEKSLYAYSANADGAPVYNTFDGEAWSGWTPYEVDWTATYQPNAYVYEDVQHVVYTDDTGKGYHTTYGADGWSGEWDDLGGNYGYDSYQYEYDDSLYLTYTGEDGGIYYKTYSGDGNAAVEPTATEEGY